MKRRISLPRAKLAVLVYAIALFGAVSVSANAQSRTTVRVREPIIGRPCEGCEAVFETLPATLSSVSELAPHGEPGQRMVIDGIVRNQRGALARGIIVYAYHTDANGIYRPLGNAYGDAARRHGEIRGWAMTDSLGHYRFTTIRPGHYPERNDPQHVHMHVIEPGCCTYYIASIHFDDDSLLDAAMRLSENAARGGTGLVHPTRGTDNAWHVRRDIKLGAGVPGYDEARRKRR